MEIGSTTPSRPTTASNASCARDVCEAGETSDDDVDVLFTKRVRSTGSTGAEDELFGIGRDDAEEGEGDAEDCLNDDSEDSLDVSGDEAVGPSQQLPAAAATEQSALIQRMMPLVSAEVEQCRVKGGASTSTPVSSIETATIRRRFQNAHAAAAVASHVVSSNRHRALPPRFATSAEDRRTRSHSGPPAARPSADRQGIERPKRKPLVANVQTTIGTNIGAAGTTGRPGAPNAMICNAGRADAGTVVTVKSGVCGRDSLGVSQRVHPLFSRLPGR